MTNMRTVSIPIPKELDEAIIDLKQKDRELVCCSYAEVVRKLIRCGLAAWGSEGGDNFEKRRV